MVEVNSSGARTRLEVRSGDARPDNATEMHVSFDRDARDTVGRYRVGAVEGRLVSTPRAVWYGAIAFNGEEALAYHAGPGTLFSPTTQPATFSIEFWLYPVRVYRGGDDLSLARGGRWVVRAGLPRAAL